MYEFIFNYHSYFNYILIRIKEKDLAKKKVLAI